MIVMEFAPGGNLKGYLRDHRTHANTVLPLTSNNLLSFALDVASGMDHLTKFEVTISNQWLNSIIFEIHFHKSNTHYD